jgi:hypothetical protein
MNEDIEVFSGTKPLPVQLSDTDRAVKGEQLADLMGKIAAEKAAETARRAEVRKAIANLEGEASKLGAVIRDHQEERPVAVRTIHRYPDGLWIEIRLDLDPSDPAAILSSRPLTAEERQRSFPGFDRAVRTQSQANQAEAGEGTRRAVLGAVTPSGQEPLPPEAGDDPWSAEGWTAPKVDELSDDDSGMIAPVADPEGTSGEEASESEEEAEGAAPAPEAPAEPEARAAAEEPLAPAEVIDFPAPGRRRGGRR